MPRNVHTGVQLGAGIATNSLSIPEATFAEAPGTPYVPPEGGTFRTVDVRTVQLLADITGVIVTAQTSAGTVRAPAGILAADDAGPGRQIIIFNDGTGDITVEDYLAGAIGTVAAGDSALLLHTSNNVFVLLPYGGGGGGGGGLLYYTLVVGNALEGDLVTDVDFLDPGDGTGIAAAIAALPASGGTIVIRRGTYTLTVPLAIARSNIRLLGEGAASTIIRSPLGSVNTLNLGDAITLYTDITIEGIRWDDREAAPSPPPGQGGIVANGVSNLLIRDCVFTGGAFPAGWIAIAVGDSAALGSSDIVVDRCRFTGTIGVYFGAFIAFGVIGFTAVGSVRFTNNHVACSGAGGYVGIDSVNGLLIDGNTFQGGAATLIDMTGGSNIAITNNVARDNDGPFIEMIGGITDFVIDGNISEQPGATAIHINVGDLATGVSNGVVSNNTLVDGQNGIRVLDSSHVTVTGNHVNSVSDSGVRVEGTSTNVVVDGNVFDANGVGVRVTVDDVIVSNNSSNGSTTAINISGNDCHIDGNQGAGNTTDFIDSGDRNQWTNNWFQRPSVSTSGAGVTALFSMPLQSSKNYVFEILMSAYRTDTPAAGDHLSEKVTFGISVTSAGTPTITTVSVDFNDQKAGLVTSYGALPGPATFTIDVTGLGGEDYDWAADIRWRNT